jgi:hypothetical protein
MARADWSKPLPRPVVIPKVMAPTTRADYQTVSSQFGVSLCSSSRCCRMTADFKCYFLASDVSCLSCG